MAHNAAVAAGPAREVPNVTLPVLLRLDNRVQAIVGDRRAYSSAMVVMDISSFVSPPAWRAHVEADRMFDPSMTTTEPCSTTPGHLRVGCAIAVPGGRRPGRDVTATIVFAARRLFKPIEDIAGSRRQSEPK